MKTNFLGNRVYVKRQIDRLNKELITAKLQNKTYEHIRSMQRELDNLITEQNNYNEIKT